MNDQHSMSHQHTDQAHDEQYPDYKKGPWDRELYVGVIIKAMATLLVITILSFVGMWWMYVAMRNSEAARDPQPGPFAEEMRNYQPPAPRLQEFPPTRDIEHLRTEEDFRLQGYGSETSGAGTAQYHLPVHRAMDILTERGLPRQGNVEEVSEELFGDTVPAATSAEVQEGGPTGDENQDGGHE